MSDKAEKLHTLMVKLVEKNTAILVPKHGKAAELPLWQAIDPLAQALGLSDYADLRDSFLALCASVRRDVETMDLNKESVRQNWLACIDQIASVFSARNFPMQSQQVFMNHFHSINLATLDTISERFQSKGYEDSTSDKLEEALGAIREAIEEFEASSKLPRSVSELLKSYLRQMETVYRLSEDFGDDLFWKAYKETFASFLQIMNLVHDAHNEETIRSKVGKAASILASRVVFGLSVGANVATIAGLLPYLQSS